MKTDPRFFGWCFEAPNRRPYVVARDTRAFQLWASHSARLGKKPLAAKASEKRGALYMYEPIGYDFWTGGGITAKSVQKAIAELGSVAALDIFINSEGGDVWEAKGIWSQLDRFAGEKVVHVDGICASAASFIAMAGDRIVSSPVATWMIHQARGMAFGTADDFRDMADVLDLENGTLAKTYADRTDSKLTEIEQWMKDELWMSAAEAKEHGFTDEIANEEESAAVAASSSADAQRKALDDLAARTTRMLAVARMANRLRQIPKNQAAQTARKSA